MVNLAVINAMLRPTRKLPLVYAGGPTTSHNAQVKNASPASRRFPVHLNGFARMSDSHESDLADNSSDTSPESTPASSPEKQSSLPPQLWLAAGVLAAVLATVAAQYTMSHQVLLGDEYQKLAEMMTLNDEQNARFIELRNIADNANEQLLLATCGAALAGVFGLFAGIIHRKPLLGLVGAAVGVGVAYGISLLASQLVIDLQKPARMEGGDMAAILMHTAQWALMGVSAAIAITVASLNLKTGLMALGVMIVAAILGSLGYVTVGMILDPMNRTGNATPAGGTALYLWTALAPLIAGTILSRGAKP